MSERPTAFYPAAPKPEWFMKVPTKLEHLHFDSAVKTGGSGSGLGDFSSAFQRMDNKSYGEYMIAHDLWLSTVDRVDKRLHDAALVRRGLESFREKPVEVSRKGLASGVPYYAKADVGVRYIPIGKAFNDKNVEQERFVKVETQKKTPHKPEISTKKFEAEKRAAKADAKQAAVARQVSVWSAKASVTRLDDKKAIVEKLTAVKKVVDNQKLHRVELKAAVGASKRSKAVMSGSPDVVSNVDPADGWKVVTRRKGDYVPSISQVLEVDGDKQKRVTISKDPAVPNSLVPKQAVRQPSVVGK